MILIVTGSAAMVLTLCAFALVKDDGTAVTGRAAQDTAPHGAAAPLREAPRTEPAPAEPAPADGGKTRSPEPSPEKKTKTPEREADVDAGHVAKPEPKPKKKKRKVLESGSCEASYYWQGQMTASGEPFDPSELTAAHKTLPMGSKVRVTNKNNGRSVTVRINDRGPFVSGRCLDLSRAAMKKVGGTGSGVIPVRYEVLSRG